MKKVVQCLAAILIVVVVFLAGAFIRLGIRTNNILEDYSSIYVNTKYNRPVYIEGIDVITQKISCGYACIEMFSKWDGGDITEETLFNEYGKVVTSNGPKFAEEMNKRFPGYTTTIHRYLTNTELIEAAYETLSEGIPVPFEWAAKYGDDWTLHYSLLIGMDIQNDNITVANPYGYIEEISVEEFLERTSFEAYDNMPFYFKMAFAIDLFDKNTIFTVRKNN
ncbi:Peptidase_C39 like family protein [Butyrivibrio proteoclasticus]|uniref:Peptidase_C39 like family protein n=1 Tax=Butyrivibrio proteoclasticus TaxID=43305 RepID=A0A1I5YY95_9FIRM|nr:C39 family peptidase [Butyrivibrio proteoclasticus]SFQ49211.1 Peptidase_C39 like family protein [Butyrivibrio proteoclasticus]